MTQVKVYDDRMTLWNAGTLPEELTIEQLIKTHESIPRNPLIAEVCYKVGYIDSWGRGVEKISEACREAGLPLPQFTERSGGILVELCRTPVKMPNEQRGKVGEEVGENLTGNQERILRILGQNPKTSAQQLAKALGISQRKVEENLRKLKTKLLLRRIGSAKGGHWEVHDR